MQQSRLQPRRQLLLGRHHAQCNHLRGVPVAPPLQLPISHDYRYGGDDARGPHGCKHASAAHTRSTTPLGRPCTIGLVQVICAPLGVVDIDAHPHVRCPSKVKSRSAPQNKHGCACCISAELHSPEYMNCVKQPDTWYGTARVRYGTARPVPHRRRSWSGSARWCPAAGGRRPQPRTCGGAGGSSMKDGRVG